MKTSVGFRRSISRISVRIPILIQILETGWSQDLGEFRPARRSRGTLTKAEREAAERLVDLADP
jgi:hypothetical protein